MSLCSSLTILWFSSPECRSVPGCCHCSSQAACVQHTFRIAYFSFQSCARRFLKTSLLSACCSEEFQTEILLEKFNMHNGKCDVTKIPSMRVYQKFSKDRNLDTSAFRECSRIQSLLDIKFFLFPLVFQWLTRLPT